MGSLASMKVNEEMNSDASAECLNFLMEIEILMHVDTKPYDVNEIWNGMVLSRLMTTHSAQTPYHQYESVSEKYHFDFCHENYGVNGSGCYHKLAGHDHESLERHIQEMNGVLENQYQTLGFPLCLPMIDCQH